MTDWSFNNVQFNTQGMHRREGLQARGQLWKRTQDGLTLSPPFSIMTFFLVKTRVKIVRQMIQVTNQIKEHQKFARKSSRSDLNALVLVFHNVKLKNSL